MKRMKGTEQRGGRAVLLLTIGLLGWSAAQSAGAQDAAGDIFALASAGDAAAVEQTLASGIDVDSRDKLGQTPMIVAALAGRGEVAAVLAKHGADVMARTDKGMTALHAAAFAGDAKVIAVLLGRGAKVNDQENIAHITALHAAAEENHIASIQALVEAGTDLSLVDVKGYTASTLAGWKQNWDVVQILVNHGDICQPEAIAGPWVFKKCMELTP